jgi:hypothetical protein
MSSFIYDLALQGFLEGSFDLATADVKVALVQISGSGTPYTADQSTDQFLSIVPSGAIASKSPQLTSPTVANGIFGAANTVFSTVTFSQPVGALVVYIDSGTPSTSPLIAYLDATNYSGLPFTPSGTNVTLSFSPTGNLIFSL